MSKLTRHSPDSVPYHVPLSLPSRLLLSFVIREWNHSIPPSSLRHLAVMYVSVVDFAAIPKTPFWQ